MSYETNCDRYLAAAHAVQSGVMGELATDPYVGEPKHLLTGTCMAMVEHSALVSLLIAKGVFTSSQYMEALADATEKEQRRFEGLLSEKLHANVKLS